MKRGIRRTVIALLCTILLTGGSWTSGVSRAARAHSPVVVDYWLNLCWQPAQTDFQHLVAAFNQSHPSILIKPRCFPNASQLQPTLLAAIHQHHPPALSQTDAFAVATYVDEGAVQDLTPYIHGRNGWTPAQINDFFPPQWQNGIYKGRTYSLPFNDTSVTVLWYNPKVLRSAHIAHPPTTWSQFARDCALVTKGGNWCMDTTDNEEPLWEAQVRQWGGRLVDPSGKHPAFYAAPGINALGYWVTLIKRGYVHHTNSSTSQWEQDFASGHVAFEVYSSEGYTDTQQVVGSKFTIGVAQMPAGPRNSDDGNGGDNIFMFNGASPAVKAAAWAYIKWATQPQWTAWWAEQLDTAPVRKSAVPLMRAYLAKHPQALPAIQELPRAYFSPTVSGWAQAQGDIDTEISKAELGQESAAQAMKNAAAKVGHDISSAG
jgi:ABC-type glycerol-3-phosphate transport system substrate-binding protein